MTTHLFKITTTRDAIQVGWNGQNRDAALRSLVQEMTAENPVLLWLYGVTRGANGPEVAPIREIAIFRHAVVQVENVSTEQPIVALPG